jgi:hypothetical protein
VKKLGIGSISLLLCIIGILFAFSFGNKMCYGDIILKFLGLNAWSKVSSGIHYTVFYSLIFFITSFIVGYKFKNNFGAPLGKIVSLLLIIFIVLASLLSV